MPQLWVANTYRTTLFLTLAGPLYNQIASTVTASSKLLEQGSTAHPGGSVSGGSESVSVSSGSAVS